MKVVATHEIDGQTVAVIEEREGDDSPFFELLVDGVRVDADPFLAPPTPEAIRSVFRSQTTGTQTQAKPVVDAIDIGLTEQERREIADGLAGLLADTYTLYLETHNYHWNVTGPMFHTLHLMFEQQYVDLALAVDVIAERIRALGMRAPGSYREFAGLSSITEESGVPTAGEMIRRLVAGQEAVVRRARTMLPIVERAHDEPTADLLTQRMQVHEKVAWMLRSLLE